MINSISKIEDAGLIILKHCRAEGALHGLDIDC
jgi:hypothetical protein